MFKVELGVSDVDHGYYADHALTVARHPSETDERMVVRLLAFGLRAHRLSDIDGELAFGAGLSTPGVPDLRLADYTGRILEWINVGQPDERVLGKAASQADQVLEDCRGHAAMLFDQRDRFRALWERQSTT